MPLKCYRREAQAAVLGKGGGIQLGAHHQPGWIQTHRRQPGATEVGSWCRISRQPSNKADVMFAGRLKQAFEERILRSSNGWQARRVINRCCG